MKFKVVGIGEVLWDMLPNGRQLGGAPANFTYHASALGAEGRLISRVGEDDLGREAVERLKALGVCTDGIEVDPALPTSTVTVHIAAAGQPHYKIHEHIAWDALSGELGAAAIASADALCFGTLAQRSERSHSTIRSLLAQAPNKALRVFDVNLRQNYFSPRLIRESMVFANVLKLNDTELPILAAMLDLRGDERSQLLQMAERNALRTVALTRGGQGSLLYREGHWSDHPGFPAKVIDTVGAGDSFTAAMTLGLLAGWELDRINENANRVAAFVCSCAGAMPSLPDELRALFGPLSETAV